MARVVAHVDFYDAQTIYSYITNIIVGDRWRRYVDRQFVYV